MAPPKLLPKPPNWRVFARCKVYRHNKHELRRFRSELFCIVQKCEKQADEWGGRQHYGNCGMSLELAAIALKKLLEHIPAQKYADMRDLFLLRAILQYETEVKMWGCAMPDVFVRIGECYMGLSKQPIAEQYAAQAKSALTERRSDQSYAFRIETIRLKRLLLEQLYNGSAGVALDFVDKLVCSVVSLPDQMRAQNAAWIRVHIMNWIYDAFWHAQGGRPDVQNAIHEVRMRMDEISGSIAAQ